jgi:hypothetical protein
MAWVVVPGVVVPRVVMAGVIVAWITVPRVVVTRVVMPRIAVPGVAGVLSIVRRCARKLRLLLLMWLPVRVACVRR